MERTVWKAVDERDVESAIVEKAAEGIQPAILEQLASVARRQPKPNAKRARGRQPFFQGRREPFDVRVDGRPALSGVDVRAVRQVEGTRSIDLHGVPLSRPARAAACRWPSP